MPCALFSTHIVGGHITYRCVGGNDFVIELFLYRDCSGVPHPSQYEVGVFNDSNNYVMSVLVDKIYEINVPPLNPGNPCLTPNACVTEALFEASINLPNSPGGYTLAVQMCCRNGGIDNITNPGNQGATICAEIPDPASTACNDGPHFYNYPPVIICNMWPLQFDHGATDLDGDSLSYGLCPAKDAPSSPPSPPSSPPYASVPYQSPYNAFDPMSSIPDLSIDPVTGFMTGFPTALGSFQVSICVDEFRNGQKIGAYHREFLLNVVSCTTNTVAAHGSPTYDGCGLGSAIQFVNASIGAAYFFWEFGTGNPADTSNLYEPTFTYADTGTYVVTLIANRGYPCADTAFATVTIANHQPVADFSHQSILCTADPISFFDASLDSIGIVASWKWSFGDGGTSSVQNPQHTYISAGNKVVTLIACNSGGCCDTVTKSLQINPSPVINAGPDQEICLGQSSQLVATGNAATWSWTPFVDMNDSSISNPVVYPTDTIIYHVTGTDGIGCSGSDSVIVNVLPWDFADLGPDVWLCVGDSVTLHANANAWMYLWSTGETTQEITVSAAGDYWVHVSQISCDDDDTITVHLLSPAVSISGLELTYLTTDPPDTLIGTPPGGIFTGPGITDSIFEPAIAGVGTHVIHYSYTDSNGCTGVDSMMTIVDSVTGINSLKSVDILLRPNPASDFITIHLSERIPVQVTIYDMSGKPLSSKGFSNGSATMELTRFSNGCYVLHVSAVDVSWRALVIKQ
jgi:PKD repeat protein